MATENYECNSSTGIGLRLREVRGSMSQAEFAEQLGVAPPSISNYETGKRIPDAEFISKLIERFSIDPTWILLGKIQGSSELRDDEAEVLSAYRNSQYKHVIRAMIDGVTNLEKGKG
jgi:transcriptional regulator with XRE-family HTH domain